MLKLRTTASVMHITAHPDDEHGGVLTKLSRGDGARLALLTLNRGESGDNAIGPQLFDALGLIRTEELLDRRSPLRRRRAVLHHRRRLRLLEAARGSARQVGPRDGAARRGAHHPHEPADDHPVAIPGQRARRARQSPDRRADGAWRRSAPPAIRIAIPEQIAEGLRPWQPKKVYIGGVRENEDWTVRIDSGEYDPRLGDSYDNVARYGLSFQRSQNSGRFTPTAGPNYGYYIARRRTVKARRDGRKSRIFDGMPTIDRSDDRRRRQADRRGGGEGDGGVHDDRSVGERAGAGAGPEADARGDRARRRISMRSSCSRSRSGSSRTRSIRRWAWS